MPKLQTLKLPMVRTFMRKNAMPMVFYAGKSAQLLGPPLRPRPRFRREGGGAALPPNPHQELCPWIQLGA